MTPGPARPPVESAFARLAATPRRRRTRPTDRARLRPARSAAHPVASQRGTLARTVPAQAPLPQSMTHRTKTPVPISSGCDAISRNTIRIVRFTGYSFLRRDSGVARSTGSWATLPLGLLLGLVRRRHRRWHSRDRHRDFQAARSSQIAGNQFAMARPISSGESSCRKWRPRTVTSVWFGQVRQKSRRDSVRMAPGSPLMNSLGTRLRLSQSA